MAILIAFFLHPIVGVFNLSFTPFVYTFSHSSSPWTGCFWRAGTDWLAQEFWELFFRNVSFVSSSIHSFPFSFVSFLSLSPCGRLVGLRYTMARYGGLWGWGWGYKHDYDRMILG